MGKPIINKITPFDGDFSKEISFSWNGDQSFANRLIIYDADTLEEIYNQKNTTFTHSHIIPAHTLVNGQRWIIEIIVYDMEDIESDISDRVLFQTFKTPLFYFYGLENAQTIRSSSYEALIYYLQENYEDIQSYKFSLYDETHTLLLESETMYDGNNIKYTYKGLDNHTVYYLSCHGITANGMEIDTGFISIYTDYKIPSTYGIIYAENDAQHGYIKLHTNIKIIQYNGTHTFRFEDGMIDLTDDFIYYDNGFVIEDDFTLILRGMRLNQTATILELRNTRFTVSISSYLNEDGTTRFKLTSPNSLGKYILYSDALWFGNKDMVTIWLRRINNIYQLEIFVEHDFQFSNNYWYGQQMPATGLEVYDNWIDTEDLFTRMVDKDNMNIFYLDEEPNDENLQIDDVWN